MQVINLSLAAHSLRDLPHLAHLPKLQTNLAFDRSFYFNAADVHKINFELVKLGRNVSLQCRCIILRMMIQKQFQPTVGQPVA